MNDFAAIVAVLGFTHQQLTHSPAAVAGKNENKIRH